MTGAMLRSIRKAYRLDVAQIANAAGLAVQAVVEYADGRKYGFVWRDGDWYRTAWVEERFLGRKVTPRFAEGDEAYPDAGLARWRNGY